MKAIECSIDELRMWMPWAKDGVPSLESERAVFAAGAVDFDRDIDWGYSMFEMQTDELVGGCGLHPRDAHTEIEIGYWVRSDRCGRGYATLAARCLTDAAYKIVAQAERTEIRMDVNNVASARVPMKLGFELDREEQRPIVTPGHTGHGLIWATTRSRWSSTSTL
jgi:RimJ/RimL family protein N-acetyltransferase